MSHFEKKNWILIFGSRLDSCDHCIVLLFVADHVKSSCLICSQAIPIKISKLILSSLEQKSSGRNFRCAVETSNPHWILLTTSDQTLSATLFHFFGTSDVPSELPTPYESFPGRQETKFEPRRNFRRPIGTSDKARSYIYSVTVASNPNPLLSPPPPLFLPPIVAIW